MTGKLNILLICSHFPPNRAVGGIRPFMFAHYLSGKGHIVTVLTGRQYDNCSRYDPAGECFEMIFHRDFKPSRILLQGIRGGCLHRLVRPVKRNLAVMSELCDVYKAASRIREELLALRNRDRHFDVIFSTYGNLTAVVSGWDAKRILGGKWILDFRDPLIQKKSRPWLWNALARLFFVRFARKADFCTCVTDGFSEIMTSYGVKAQTLYNGFSDCQNVPAHYTQEGNHLKICYTGSFYTGGLEDKALASLLGALRVLVDTGRLGLNDIRFTFAGRKTDKAGPVFRKFGLESMLESRGMLSGDEAVRLQQESDVFLVLSWNMTDEYGVVPAKTYEGMKEGRVILASVHGNLPNSELSLIIKKYNLGFCYEDSLDGEHFSQLCAFLEKCVREKKGVGMVTCNHNPACRMDFNYSTLTSQLENILIRGLPV